MAGVTAGWFRTLTGAAEPPAPSPAPKVEKAATPPAPKQGPILTGKIVDDKGRPLPGVKVVLYSGFATRWRGQEAITDANGEYRFDPLTTGSWTRDAANNPARYVGMELYHATQASADGHSWWDEKVPAIDRREHVRNFTMVPGGQLTGRVLNEDGTPSAKLNLHVYGPVKLKPGGGGTFHRYATTDADGKFSVVALFPGDYTIDINDPVRNYPVIGEVKIAANQTATVTLKDPPPDADFKKLQGTWVPVRMEGWAGRGKEEFLPLNTLTIKGDVWTVGSAEEPATYRMAIDSSKQPKEIDLYANGSAEMRWLRGYYVVDGDTLTVWLSSRGRPDLPLTPGDGRRLLVLQRER